MTKIYENTPEFILLALLLAGLAFVIFVVMLAIVMLSDFISISIRNAKKRYAIKHRFDKPPIAKCYCIDCKRHSDDGRCYKFEGWLTADSWFCWDAEPKER